MRAVAEVQLQLDSFALGSTGAVNSWHNLLQFGTSGYKLPPAGFAGIGVGSLKFNVSISFDRLR